MPQAAPWLDRFFNSTFGLPQQILFRLLKRPEEFLTTKGLFDTANIPFLGTVLSDHSNQVRARDLGAKGFWGELLVETLADPAFYMTAGLTGAAKAARGINKAATLKGATGLQAAAAGKKTAREAAEAMLKAADEIGDPRIRDKARVLLGDALDHGKGLDVFENGSLAELAKRQRDHELLFGPLGLANLGFGIRVPTKHQSWLRLMATPGTAPLAKAHAVLGGRNIPYLTKAYKPIGEFVEGVRLGTEARLLPSIPEAQVDDVAGLLRKTDTQERFLERWARQYGPEQQGFDRKLGKLVEGGADPHEAFRALFQLRKDRSPWELGKAWHDMRRRLGLPDADLTMGSLASFFREAREANAAGRSVLNSATPDVLPRVIGASLDVNSDLVTAGEKVAQAWHKTFKGNSGFKWIDEFEEAQRIATGMAHGDLEAKQRAVQTLYFAVSEATGESVDSVRKLFRILMETTPHEDEIHALGEGVADFIKNTPGPLDLKDAARFFERDFDSFLNGRLADATEVLDKDNGALAKLVRRGLDEAGFPGDLVPHEVQPQVLGRKLSDEARAAKARIEPGRPYAAKADGEVWEMNRSAANQAGVSVIDHSAAVREALQAGKDVPVEVLMNYPHLLGTAPRTSMSPYARLQMAKAQGQAWLRSAKEASGAGDPLTQLPAAYVKELTDAMGAFKDAVLRPFHEMAMEAAERGGGLATQRSIEEAWNALRSLQSQHLSYSRALGFVGRSMPIAHVPRNLSIKVNERARKLLGRIPDATLNDALGKRGAAQVRESDRFTVFGLNDVIEDLRKHDAGRSPELNKIIDDLEKLDPELTQKFQEDAATAFVTSLSGLTETKGIAEYLDSMVGRALKDPRAPILGGRVVAAGIGGQIFRRGRRVDSRIMSDGRISSTLMESLQSLPDRFIVIERADGSQVPIPLTRTENGMTILSAGSGESVGRAMADRVAKRGDKGELLGASSADEQLRKLVDEGAQVIAGGSDVVSGVAANIAQSADQTFQWFRTGYDTVHHLLKGGATVVRADFTLFNWLSYFPMVQMQGSSFKAATGGMMDAIELFRQRPTPNDWYGRAMQWERSRHGWLKRQISPLQGVRSRAQLLGADWGDQVFQSGDHAYNIGELFHEWRRAGLWSTFTTSEVRVAGRETKKLRRIREAVETMEAGLDNGTLFDKAGRLTNIGAQTIQKVADSGELVTRIAAGFAYMRMGMDPYTAGKQAVYALVDYGDKTRIAQTMDRYLFSFGQFARKMVPSSLRAASRNPAKFTTTARALAAPHFTNADRGALEARFGDYRVNLQRALPFMDAISHMAFMVDSTFNWDQFSSTPERIGSNSFMLGIPPQILVKALGEERGGGFVAAAQQALRTSYLTRWSVKGYNDPMAPEPTVFDHTLRFMTGTTKAPRGVRARWLRGQYNTLLAEAQQRLRDPDEDREFWKGEIRALTAVTNRLLAQEKGR